LADRAANAARTGETCVALKDAPSPKTGDEGVNVLDEEEDLSQWPSESYDVPSEAPPVKIRIDRSMDEFKSRVCVDGAAASTPEGDTIATLRARVAAAEAHDRTLGIEPSGSNLGIELAARAGQGGVVVRGGCWVGRLSRVLRG
jgi:hypothetical protein